MKNLHQNGYTNYGMLIKVIYNTNMEVKVS